MLTKAEEARIANDKARINDLVSTEVLASYDNKGELDQKTLIENLEGMPANVTGLDEYKENLESGNEPIWPMEFQVDGYNVTVEWNGKVTVGDPSEGGSTPTPSDKTLREITLSIEPKEINVGDTATITATMTPTDAEDTLNFTAEPAENVKITTEGTTATIEGVKAGEVTITVSGTKNPEKTSQCTVTVKEVEVANQALEEGEFDYLGYYAYLDADDEPDGIIYADLATDKEGQWSDDFGVYKYTNKKGSGLKKYTVVEEEKSSEKFGNYTAPGIRVAEGGGANDRFYVMALENVVDSTTYWYYYGYGKLDTSKVIEYSVKDFDQDSGKENTRYWLEKHNDPLYQLEHGKPYEFDGRIDLWGMESLKQKQSEGWFVPSKVEWAAFADMCENNEEISVTGRGGYDFGCFAGCWSSSLLSDTNAYRMDFTTGRITKSGISNGSYVRLSTTF